MTLSSIFNIVENITVLHRPIDPKYNTVIMHMHSNDLKIVDSDILYIYYTIFYDFIT